MALSFARCVLRPLPTLHPLCRTLFTEVAGTRLYYEREGIGSHPVLLLPGALGSTKTDFQSQLGPQGMANSPKAAGNLTVVAWDPPGYGQSRPPARTWPQNFFDRDAEMAVGLMRKLGLTPFSVAGWSDGGITALIMAIKFTEPGEIRSMSVWGANSYITPEERDVINSISDVKNWSPRMRASFEEVYGVQGFSKLWLEWVGAFLNYTDICRDSLTSLRLPTLILHGAKDPIVPGFHPEHINASIPGSDIVIWPEGKHNVHIRYSQEFNKILTEFLLKH